MIELKKNPIYKAKTEPEIIEVPASLYVMVNGRGAPENNPTFEQAMQILYGIVYTIKFWGKNHLTPDDYDKFSIPPLEALWWVVGDKDFGAARHREWRWVVMLRLPDFVTPRLFRKVQVELITRKKTMIYAQAKLQQFDEGLSAQLLHVGPYDRESDDINALHNFIQQNGCNMTGRHHEIYLSDPRRTRPENLRTIIRQPIAQC